MAPVVDRVQETVGVVLLNLVVNFVLSLHAVVTKGVPALRQEARRLPDRARQFAAWLAHVAALASSPEVWARVRQEAARAEAALHRADDALVEALEKCLVYLTAQGKELDILARAELARLPARKEAALWALGPAFASFTAQATSVMKQAVSWSRVLREEAASYALLLKAEAANRGLVPGWSAPLELQPSAVEVGGPEAEAAAAESVDLNAPASAPAPASEPEAVRAPASDAFPVPVVELPPSPDAASAPQLEAATEATPSSPIAPALEGVPGTEVEESKEAAEAAAEEVETTEGVAQPSAPEETVEGAVRPSALEESAVQMVAEAEAAPELAATSTRDAPSAPELVAPEQAEVPVTAAVEAAPAEAAPADVEAAPAAATHPEAQEPAQKAAVPASIPIPASIPVPEIGRRIVRATTLNSTIHLPPNSRASHVVLMSPQVGPQSHSSRGSQAVPSSPLVGSRSQVGSLSPARARFSGRLTGHFLLSPRVRSMSQTLDVPADAYLETRSDSTRARAHAKPVDSRVAAEEAQLAMAREAARAVRAAKARAAQAHEAQVGKEALKKHKASRKSSDLREDPFDGYASDTKLRRSRSSRSFWSSREVPAARSRRT